MGIQIAVAGNGIPQQELPQERVFAKTVQSRSSELRAVVAERIRESLPGGRRNLPADIMADLEKVSLAFNKKLKFEVNHQSRDVIIKVIDPQTDKVIKVLPPEELQRLHSRLKETIGFLFDERI
ncbi:MAG: flagellar protein FlaG [Treponema sp.]|jgi:flagellar protein FlaG|nr:flagellar protein FlaG [Treponema sp.]